MKPNVGQKSIGNKLVLKSTKKLFYRGKRPKFKTSAPRKLKRKSNGQKRHTRICNSNTKVKSRDLTLERALLLTEILQDSTISRFLDFHAPPAATDLAQNDRPSDYSSLGTDYLAENLDIPVTNDPPSLSDSVRSSHLLSSLGTQSLNSEGLLGSFDISQLVIAAQLDSEERAETESRGEQISSISEFEGDQVELNAETRPFPIPTLPQRLAICEENNNNGSYDLACSPKGQHWLLNNNQKDYFSYNPLESRSSVLSLNACSSVEPSENLILSFDESRGSYTGFPLSNPGGTLGSVSQILPRCSSPRSEAISELNVDGSHQGFSASKSYRLEFPSDFESLPSCVSEPSVGDWGKSQENLTDLLDAAQLFDVQSYPSCGKSPTDEHSSHYRTSQNTKLLSEEVNVLHDSLISQELNVSLPCLSQESGNVQQASKTLQSQNQQFVNAQAFVDMSDQAYLTVWQTSSFKIPTGRQTLQHNIPTGLEASPHYIPTGRQTSQHNIPTGLEASPHNIPTGLEASPHNIPTGWLTSHHNIPTGRQTSQHNIPTGLEASPHNIPTGWQTSQHNIPTGWQTSPHNIQTGRQTSQHNIQTGRQTSHHNIPTGWQTSPHNIPTGQQTSQHNIPAGLESSPHNIPTGGLTSPHNIPRGLEASPHNISTGRQTSQHNIPAGLEASPHNIPTEQQTSPLNIPTESDNLNSLEEFLAFLRLEELTDILREASSAGDLAPVPETWHEASTQAVDFLRSESTSYHIYGETQITSDPAQVEDESHFSTLHSDQMQEIEEPHLLVVERSRDESAWNELMPIPLPVLPLSSGQQESGQVQDDDVDLSQLNLGPLPPALLGFPLPDDVDVHDTDIDMQMMRRNRHRN